MEKQLARLQNFTKTIVFFERKNTIFLCNISTFAKIPKYKENDKNN